MPPSEWLRLCTQPRPFWNAIAPCIDALIMFRRASRSCGSLVARSICAQARHKPSSAIPSAGGLKDGAMKVSRQCAIASMPVAAVIIAGRFRVSSGSQIAKRGTAYGHALGEVDRRTAAHGDDAVTDTVAEHLDRSAHGVFIRVRGSLIKHGDLCTVFQLGDNLVEDACVANTHIGDDQRFADTDAVAFLLQQRECAEVELNLGNVVNQCHYIALKL